MRDDWRSMIPAHPEVVNPARKSCKMFPNAVRSAGVRVAYTDAAVAVYELEPGGWVCRERRLPYSRDFDPDVLRVDNYIPFNTLLIERRLRDQGELDDAGLQTIEGEIRAALETAIAFAEASPFPLPEQATDDVFAA